MVSSTIKDIAAAIGVSASTVSRALAGSSLVNRETRARILRVARELGYTPNLMAQGMVRGSSRLVGCLVQEFANPAFVPMLRAAEDVLRAQGFITVAAESRQEPALESEALRRFQMIHAAGAVVAPVDAAAPHLADLARSGFPLVMVGARHPALDCVTADDERAGYLAGQHLIRLGHRRIGTVLSGQSGNLPEQLRLKGLVAAVREAGLRVHPHWAYAAGPGVEGGRRSGAILCRSTDRPTAVLAQDDALAMGLIRAVHAAGLRVPGDLAVIGHGDALLAGGFEVPLTTVSLPRELMGQHAARMLLDRLAGRGRPERGLAQLDPHLVVRQSCGGARSAAG